MDPIELLFRMRSLKFFADALYVAVNHLLFWLKVDVEQVKQLGQQGKKKHPNNHNN